MRSSLLLLPLLLLGAPGAAPAKPSDRAMARMLFVGPNGKPWRGQPGQPYPSAAWFAAADADHDGKLTRAEYTAEFLSYFDALDTDHDGEIAPPEISTYEHVILPEVQMSGGAFGGIGSPQPASGGDDDDSAPPQPPERPGGASFFGFFGAPEPLTAMDTNFDRGINRAEFAAAAARTWRMLDPDGKPWLTLADLPKTQAQR
jgi:hypothetical protein